MGIARGANIVRDYLVFGYDTNYGVANNYISTRFYKGKQVDNMATDPIFLNSTAGTFTSVAWGGDTGFGEFATNTSPDGGGLMYINNNTSTAAGGGGNYNDLDVNNWTLTNGVTYTRSWWAKSNITQTINGHMLSVNGGGNNTYILGGDTDLVAGEWQRVSHTFTCSGTSNLDWRFRSINYNQSKVYIANIQLEVGSYASPFTATSRSSTQSLIDLKRTNNIDVSNSSFDSTGQLDFDGSSDSVLIGNVGGYSDKITVESIFKTSSSATWKNMLCGATGDIIFTVYQAKLNFGCQGNTPIPHSNYSTTNVNDGQFHHGVATYDGSSVKIYVDGVLESTTTRSGTITPSILRAGSNSAGNSEFFNGSIPLVKLYNKALTATEIKQNFNAYKNRFNI